MQDNNFSMVIHFGVNFYEVGTEYHGMFLVSLFCTFHVDKYAP